MAIGCREILFSGMGCNIKSHSIYASVKTLQNGVVVRLSFVQRQVAPGF